MQFFRIITIFLSFFLVLIPGESFCQRKMERYKQEAFQCVEKNKKTFEDAAMAIHGFAETLYREYKSSMCLADLLEKDGFKVERGVADIPTAFVAVYGSGIPVIGILAEYDALPGLSQKPGVPYREPIEEGASGHGCGHNLFGSGSTAAAMAMKAVMQKHSLKGTVKLFGCPAEEGGSGKVYMSNAGVFQGIDVCLTWHPSDKNNVHLGSTLALNRFEVIFRGKSAHGAVDPWNGRSALDAVELMSVGVNYLREHVKPTVRIHSVIKDGGMAPNIVPDYARIYYYVRDVDRSGVEEVYKRVLKCAEGAALMTETTCEAKLMGGVYEYLTNRTLSEVVDRNMRLVGAPQFTEEEIEFAKTIQKNIGFPEVGLVDSIDAFKMPEDKGGGSTDVGDVSWLIPTSGETHLVAAPVGIPWHSWAVVSSSGSSIGFKGMHTAAKVLAASGIEILMNSKIIDNARKEFNEKTKGFVYKSAVSGKRHPILDED